MYVMLYVMLLQCVIVAVAVVKSAEERKQRRSFALTSVCLFHSPRFSEQNRDCPQSNLNKIPVKLSMPLCLDIPYSLKGQLTWVNCFAKS